MKGISASAPVAVALYASSAFASGLPAAFLHPLSPRQTSLPEVSVKGNAFFAGNDRFYVRGVDYQPGGSSDPQDPIADVDVCRRDIAKFKELKVNTVRIYTVDNSKNHDECMSLLAQAGIYLALDVNTPKYSIRQDKPGPSYNHVYLQNIFATMDVFANYSNTLLFFSGNEVINNVATSAAAPYVKAVTRDMRRYREERGMRQIPIGYSAADIDDNRMETAQYMNCGTDDERSDFFAFNDYSWCAPSSYKTSTWQQKVKDFGNYSIPIFLSEYGCTETDRNFEEIATLYSDDMTPVYSGGLVYEYSMESGGGPRHEKYGLVDIDGDEAEELDQFSVLKKALEKTPAPSGDGGYKEDGTPSECPSKSSTWLVDGDGIPAMPPRASQYFQNGAGQPVGLSGTGSQEVGAESPGTASAGSGRPTGTGTSRGSSSSSSGAAAALRVPEMSFAPMVCGMVVIISSLIGASLL
ncbi:MAG: hypothetical protein Q9163_003154 [Psora crenata]